MSKKEEFPTFLNEQPTIIFGRTGRELMIMACGLAGAYTVWAMMSKHGAGSLWTILTVAIAVIPALISVAIALVSIAGRPLEEWFVIWLLYAFMPKVFLYLPGNGDEEDGEGLDEEVREQGLLVGVDDEADD